MKEIQNKTLETLFDKVTKSKLPDWAKTLVMVSFALSLAVTPLLEVLSRLILVNRVTNLLEKLLGF